MSRVIVTKTINIPIQFVFSTISEIENYSKAVPHIVNVVFLSETRIGVGSKFRETRVMWGKEVSTVLEVSEYVPNERIRLVSDAGGTIWDSLFTVREVNEGTELVLTMDTRPYKLTAKILNIFMKGMVLKGIKSDLDAVKAYCERE